MTIQVNIASTDIAKCEVDGDVLRVFLPCGKVMLADVEDMELIKSHRWYLSAGQTTNYAVAIRRVDGIRKRFGLAHRLIMKAPDGFDVDHINRDGLDNRKENLRICTRSQNKMNSIGRRGARKSVYKGVTEYGDYNRYWRAELKIQGMRYKFYGCATDEEAAAYYDLMASLFHKEFALFNFPDGTPDHLNIDPNWRARVSVCVKGGRTGRKPGVPQKRAA